MNDVVEWSIIMLLLLLFTLKSPKEYRMYLRWHEWRITMYVAQIQWKDRMKSTDKNIEEEVYTHLKFETHVHVPDGVWGCRIISQHDPSKLIIDPKCGKHEGNSSVVID